MVAATRIKGGKVKVLLGNDANPIVYTAQCGFTSKSITITKGLEEVNIPDCDDPDKVDWVGRDASSLSMAISGEGVLAEQSAEVWFAAVEDVDSVPVKVEMEFPSKTITWTGRMQVESVGATAPNGQTVTSEISMQSDGEMVRTTTPAS